MAHKPEAHKRVNTGSMISIDWLIIVN